MSEKLRESGQVRNPSGVAAKKRAHEAAPDAGLTLEPHVCRECFGRLASEAVSGGHRRYRCTNCGAVAVGLDASVLCACGTKVRRQGVLVDAGLRCQRNPAPSPEFPSLFVAAEPLT